MDKKQLMQYRALLKEQPELEREISRLYKYLECKAAEGKIKSNEGMYIETKSDKPGPATKSGAVVEIKRQIMIKEKRLEKIEKERTRIEQFIADMPDSMVRQIFELCFLAGKTQREVGESVGYSRGRISQIISTYLKDQEESFI